nr:reductive dehalogenase [uncultured bacterium]
MSKFHSTVSRRDFMKGLGIGTAGAGVAAVTAPTFHDLDELSSTIREGSKHPWYVKELEHEQMSNEVDWSQIQRINYDDRLISATRSSNAEDYPVVAQIRALKDEGRDTHFMQELYPSYKEDIRDAALSAAGSFTRVFRNNFDGSVTVNREVQEMDTPADFTKPTGGAYPAWQGTPEENLRTLTAALRFFGGAELGVVELTEKTKKLIYSQQGGKRYVFRDVDFPEETETEYIIPNKAKNIIVWTSLQPTQLTFTQPAGANASGLSYDRMYKISANMHAFIHGLGYLHMDGTSSSLSPSNPFGALAGVGEHSRACMNLTSYKYGNTIRGMNRIITDMPLAPTRPIDAGVFTFCQSCGICAEACPYDAMPLGKSRWDSEFEDENEMQNYIGGFDGFRLSLLRCPRCRACQAACVFNSSDDAIIHDTVRAISGTTSLFNGFFTDMSKAFGYGLKNPNEWWEKDLPIYDQDMAFVHK